jgi:hypothetical protein
MVRQRRKPNPLRTNGTTKCLLLGVHRDHRESGITKLAILLVEVSELGVAIRMLTPLDRLRVGLEAVSRLLQEGL